MRNSKKASEWRELVRRRELGDKIKKRGRSGHRASCRYDMDFGFYPGYTVHPIGDLSG